MIVVWCLGLIITTLWLRRSVHRQNEKYVGKVNFDASRVCVGREAGECVWSAYVYFEFTSNFRVFHDVFLTWNHAL